jgi:protease-4
MSFETDLLLDRRRLKRRLVFWRGLTVAALVLAAIIGFRQTGLSIESEYIARLNVTGVITEDRKMIRLLGRLADNDDAKALIVAINSPGGTMSGGESLYRAIAAVAEKKPVIAVMGGLAASAGYMVAMPAHHVLARESTITGSIGVLLETGDVSGLLGKLGITTEAIRSGVLKDQPNYTRPLTPGGREALQGIVNDMYEQFVIMVAKGRKMDPVRVRLLGDGRAYTGRQALSLGLIDAIGDEQDARKWLATEKGVERGLPVQDLTTATFAQRTFGASLADIADVVWKSLISQSVSLDGGMAVWHPPGG